MKKAVEVLIIVIAFFCVGCLLTFLMYGVTKNSGIVDQQVEYVAYDKIYIGSTVLFLGEEDSYWRERREDEYYICNNE